VDSTLYHQLIGSLMYLVNARPDICFSVNTLSQFMVGVDRPFSIGGQLMCHEEMHRQMPYCLKTFGSTGQCLAQHLFL
jgi:hypothetical protein